MSPEIITMLGVIIVAVIGWWGGRRSSNAQATSTDQDTINKQSRQINELVVSVNALRIDVDKYQRNIEVKDDLLAEKTETIETLSVDFNEFKTEVREYFTSLKGWFETKNITDYPEIPSKLLETNPRIKRAGK